MLLIGSHVKYNSTTQLLGSVKEAISYGATTFMFYTGAPQNTLRSPINKMIVEDAKKLMEAKEHLEKKKIKLLERVRVLESISC